MAARCHGDTPEATQARRANTGPQRLNNKLRVLSAAYRLTELFTSAGTWTSCAPGPTPATRPPPCSWPDLLAERGDLDQAEQLLRARADAGDEAARRLAELLTQQGRGEEAERLRRFGLAPDGSTASK